LLSYPNELKKITNPYENNALCEKIVRFTNNECNLNEKISDMSTVIEAIIEKI